MLKFGASLRDVNCVKVCKKMEQMKIMHLKKIMGGGKWILYEYDVL
jgi:hypothetical protein